MRFLFLLTLICLYSKCSFAKIFTECELARELRDQGIAMSKIPDWVCMITVETGRNTESKSGPRSDGSSTWGIFKFDDNYWCTPGTPGKGCNVKCEDLMQDDITAAVKCADYVHDIQGFSAWAGWKNHCKDRRIPNLSKCFLQHGMTINHYYCHV